MTKIPADHLIAVEMSVRLVVPIDTPSPGARMPEDEWLRWCVMNAYRAELMSPVDRLSLRPH